MGLLCLLPVYGEANSIIATFLAAVSHIKTSGRERSDEFPRGTGIAARGPLSQTHHPFSLSNHQKSVLLDLSESPFLLLLNTVGLIQVVFIFGVCTV